MEFGRPVFAVDACRSPIGKYGGKLAGVRPDDLAAHVLRAVVARNGLDPSCVDEVVFGCANQAGEDNRNVARMAALLADFPFSVPALTVNRLCASGLDAVAAAARSIAVGEADVVLAGGVESMSRAPWAVAKPHTEPPRGNNVMYDTALGWRFPNPKLAARFALEQMGETAENLADHYAISRLAQDQFAVSSHAKAIAARDAGRFANEIVPIEVAVGKGVVWVDADEQPRPDCTLEALTKLRPAFRAGGSVTAGNSSTLNDGAAVVLLASEQAVNTHGWQPLARMTGFAQAGVDPRTMGIGPVPAIRKLLARTKWRPEDVQWLELNEAFAAQALSVLAELPFDREVVNPDGGAIALGHPLGCSGARIVGHLLFAMRANGLQRGIASLCVGVGQGAACSVERV
ncbi:MAG: thiolase family protein [Myxococcales bacterium]|nr:thiolase family protein [Myxococcales bacterium]